MNKVQHDFVNILSPPVVNAEQVDEIFHSLESLFSKMSLGMMNYPVCDSKTTVNNRLDYIKKGLKNNGGISLGDKSRNIYVSIFNVAYPMGNTGTNYCQLMLGVRRDTFPLSIKKWLKLVSNLCEHVNAYWGGVSQGDDYYTLNHILQRVRYLQAQAEGREDWNKETSAQIRKFLDQYTELNQLPSLDLAGYIYKINDVRIVSDIRWINYWSKSICEYNHLSNLSSLFEDNIESIKTASGACVWALTSEPWQMRNKKHRERLVRAYQQFPNVGLRLKKEHD